MAGRTDQLAETGNHHRFHLLNDGVSRLVHCRLVCANEIERLKRERRGLGRVFVSLNHGLVVVSQQRVLLVSRSL